MRAKLEAATVAWQSDPKNVSAETTWLHEAQSYLTTKGSLIARAPAGCIDPRALLADEKDLPSLIGCVRAKSIVCSAASSVSDSINPGIDTLAHAFLSTF
jgi:hypothetical protein